MIVSSALMIWKGLMVATGSGIVQLFAELERLFSTKICDSNRQQLTLQKFTLLLFENLLLFSSGLE